MRTNVGLSLINLHLFQYCVDGPSTDKKWFVTPNPSASYRVKVKVKVDNVNNAAAVGVRFFLCIPDKNSA